MSIVESMEMTHLKMTNFDHTVDDGLEEVLKEKPGEVCCQYAAYNFCGYVWFVDDKFHCEVWVHHNPIEVILEDTLEEIMESVSDKYGHD